MKSALWQTVLGEIELEVSRASFATWFKNTVLLKADDDLIKIGVPNIFAKQQLEVKFSELISNTLARNGVKAKKIEYRIHSRPASKSNSNKEKSQPLPSAQKKTDSKPSPVTKAAGKSGLNNRYNFD